MTINSGESMYLRCRPEPKCLWNTLDLKEPYEKGPTPKMTSEILSRKVPFNWFIKVISIRSSRP